MLVAGGGVGGVAAALALARGGADVQVLERAPAFTEVGAGLQLAPNATRILHRMGLEAPLRRHAYAPEAVEIRDRAGGGLLLRQPLGRGAVERWGAPYLQLHRADLLAVLVEAALAAGARLVPGSEIAEVEATAGGVAVRLADGRSLHGDVLVGADGLRSRVREAVQGRAPARATGEIAWRGVVRSDRLPAGLIARAATVWTGPGAHAVHYFVRGGAAVNFAGFTRREGHSAEEGWTRPAAPGDFTRAFGRWPEPVRRLAQALDEGGGWRASVFARPARPGWSRGRLTLLGDAAHPMAPYLAQGAGMAVEDAESLARHLGGEAEPEVALARYAAERFARTRRVQAWAERNGAVFHLPQPLRRAAFAVAERTGAGGSLDWLYGYDPCPTEAFIGTTVRR